MNSAETRRVSQAVIEWLTAWQQAAAEVSPGFEDASDLPADLLAPLGAINKFQGSVKGATPFATPCSNVYGPGLPELARATRPRPI